MSLHPPDRLPHLMHPTDHLLTVEQTQTALARSRASIYRYANTSRDRLNPPFDPQRLNAEYRNHPNDPVLFRVSEVERFAREVLGIEAIEITVEIKSEAIVGELLQSIAQELQEIKHLLLTR